MALRVIIIGAGTGGLLQSLHTYEAEMIQRGFDAVEASLQQMSQVHTTNRLASTLRRLFFRVVDQLPVKFKKAVLKHR